MKKATTGTVRNRLQLVRSGKDYFDLLKHLLARAEDSVYIQVYIFDDDETGRQVVDELKSAVKRGVRVYLLVDGFGVRMSHAFIRDICAVGIFFRKFQPLFSGSNIYLGRRLHNKLVVVDGVYSLVGGRNIADYYNDLPGSPAWLDMAVFITGDACAELEKLCVSMWNTVFGKGTKAVPTAQEVLESRRQMLELPNDVPVDVRRNDWIRGKTEILNSYYQMFANAQKEVIVMGSYFLPGYKLRKKMQEAARRCRIVVVVTGVSDIWLAKYAERYLYNWMIRNKIEVYEYTRNVLHAKVALCDESFLTIGSFNVNNISAHVSVELNVDIRAESFVGEVKEILRNIISTDCAKVEKPDFSFSFNLFARLAERVAYETVRLMLYLVTFYYKRSTPKTEAAEYKY